MDTPTRVQSPATVAGHAEASSTLTFDLANLPQADSQLGALLPHLARLDDNQLIRLAADARRLEACAFRLRGACVAELRRRIKIRLTGGRGRRDASGIGTGAQLARLAENIGVSLSTLKTDARIHEVFFTNGAETRLACEPSLAREFYVTALAAPDPHSAIQLAKEKCIASSYKREDFRRDVLALKQAAQPALASTTIKAAPKPVADLCVRVIAEAHPVLENLISLTGQSPETIVAEALLAYHKSLTAVQPNSIPKNQRRAIKPVDQPLQPSLLSSP